MFVLQAQLFVQKPALWIEFVITSSFNSFVACQVEIQGIKKNPTHTNALKRWHLPADRKKKARLLPMNL